MNVVFLCFLFLAVVEYSDSSNTKTKCDVVKALRAENVSDGDLRDWLCLVAHESRFKYDATNDNLVKGSNTVDSTDYGIYQINSKYWCGHGDISNPCWDGCGIACDSMLDEDISDDTKCAVIIKNCGSFKKWRAWREYCKGKPDELNKAEYDYSGC